MLFKKTLQKELKKLEKKYDSVELKKLPEYRLKVLDIRKQFKDISDYDYDIGTSKIINENKDKSEKEVAELNIMLKYNKITPTDYCIKKYDALNLPWYHIEYNYDPEKIEDIDQVPIEVEYNKTFIKLLKEKKYIGDSDEEVIDDWLKTVYQNQLDIEDINDMLDKGTTTTIKTPVSHTNKDGVKIIG